MFSELILQRGNSELSCRTARAYYSSPKVILHSCSFLRRKGVVVNETAVVLYGQLLTGRKYVPKANGVVELEKQWAKQVLPFAYQTVVKVHAYTCKKEIHG